MIAFTFDAQAPADISAKIIQSFMVELQNSLSILLYGIIQLARSAPLRFSRTTESNSILMNQFSSPSRPQNPLTI